MTALTNSERTFTTTRWTVVMAAGGRESEQADAALEQLCRGYWYPIYVFLRRSGWTAHDAQDLTQAFFTRILEKNYLSAVDRTKGKFRSFLLAMLRHFLANHRRDRQAQKRGGRAEFVCLDDAALQEPASLVSTTEASAEQAFEQQWAVTLLEQVMARLQAEHEKAGKLELFNTLKIFLTASRGAGSYSDLAVKLDTTEAALKMAVSRMRRRYGELLREEISRTVSTPQEADEELRALFAALS
jgi:DNA-directed RNA polymerase specialized sigma24 family protein